MVVALKKTQINETELSLEMIISPTSDVGQTGYSHVKEWNWILSYTI